jgi:nucleotide-binding universal stress UspA family protein|uniref:Universal stress protein n=1 Tax=Desulfobacca acetoxidans TaxID=60893 RepID=A0A7V6DP03_9BACT
MKVRTILWPTDLSKLSLKAAPHVNSLAEKYQAKVIVMYVGADLMNLLPYGGKYPSEEQLRHFQAWEKEQARKKLETVCEAELKACPMFEVRLVEGDPAAQILQAIKKEKADMVVLSSHGRGADDLDATSPEFGSVARKVLANAKVPVHLVNPFQQ